ncbi:MAG: hypothetical protein BWY36_00997 [Candidatus Diapherotrites archaeon ADurb.Bin253]|nr:MAG: hypothetical protein BWY36_00997 [Candidatus Diapherotrites archaeon ADurb.Bin253]
MKPYKREFLEQLEDKDLEQLEIEKEKESKAMQKLLKSFKNNSSRNKDARAEFAKNIFQLSLSSCIEARKFISKCMDFAAMYGDDFYIDEEEWRKLNNTDKLDDED